MLFLPQIHGFVVIKIYLFLLVYSYLAYSPKHVTLPLEHHIPLPFSLSLHLHTPLQLSLSSASSQKLIPDGLCGSDFSSTWLRCSTGLSGSPLARLGWIPGLHSSLLAFGSIGQIGGEKVAALSQTPSIHGTKMRCHSQWIMQMYSSLFLTCFGSREIVIGWHLNYHC